MFVFLITSVIFLLFAFIGKVSKVDFRKMGIYLLFMLLGIVIVSIINIFLQSSSLALGLSVFGVMLFMGFILYDMKMLDTLEEVFGTDKAAVYGAFQLYIDFINLFLDILRLLGKSKD
jgi:FtsH-binding integral membrane protein